MLLGTAAAIVLFDSGGAALAGPDICITIGTVATCTGDHSDGIAEGADFFHPGVTTLIVEDLTGDIAPAPGAHGIDFNIGGATDALFLDIDTGPFSVVATGGGRAVRVVSLGEQDVTLRGTFLGGVSIGGDVDANLTNYGTIISAGEAIFGASSSDAIDNHGTVTGNVNLGGGVNVFNNMLGGTLNMGPVMSFSTPTPAPRPAATRSRPASRSSTIRDRSSSPACSAAASAGTPAPSRSPSTASPAPPTATSASA